MPMNVLMMLVKKHNMLHWKNYLLLFVTDKKAYVNSKLPSGWNCVMMAVEADQLEVVEWLVQQGADIHYAMPVKGWTCGSCE